MPRSRLLHMTMHLLPFAVKPRHW